MNRIVFSLIISLIVFSGNVFSQKIDSICGTRCEKVRKLKSYRFSKKNFQEKLNELGNLVDTSSVYLVCIPPDTPYKRVITYRFLRFFGNGIVFESCDYTTEPNEIQYNDLCYGFLFMYCIENNDIVTESRMADESYWWWYFYAHVSINRDTLIFYKLKKGRIFPKYEKMNSIYVRKKVSLYNFKWWEHSNPKDLRIPWKEREKRKIERRLRKEKKER